MKQLLIFLILAGIALFNTAFSQERTPVIISTDIGGDDPDDFQSLVHFLLYADRFEILGLISSPPGKGRKSDILEVIEAYEADFPKMSKISDSFPSAAYLKTISIQGEVDPQVSDAPDRISAGAGFLASQVLKYGKPVYVLVWGSITDLAQALHFHPEIKPLLRVYSIGSWNTKQDQKSRDYIDANHPDLWWIENNTTFRGMYMGGIQDFPWGNASFVKEFVEGAGDLGSLFFEKKQDIKMGDTPSVLYLLHGVASDPEGESWGGSFCKREDRPNYWTDCQNRELAENGMPGAKTVNRFRQQYLADWRGRMIRLK
jgi:hypothetical protein